ncbi:hypothetical protein DICVIV_02381 [Dictyocaulus viviparus]|uniref:Uncharacterized protein n=1 Tax=Dictyocaulus viviparus TaxID=29172 RepID=A0A0D8Y640_DICVI|nr:hypothetical protein DICVIV_02381 [Dictyocaulus viviparus]
MQIYKSRELFGEVYTPFKVTLAAVTSGVVSAPSESRNHQRRERCGYLMRTNLMWICLITIFLNRSAQYDRKRVDVLMLSCNLFIELKLSKCPGHEFGEYLRLYDIMLLMRHQQNYRHGVWTNTKDRHEGVIHLRTSIDQRKFARGKIFIFCSFYTITKQRKNDNPEYLHLTYGSERKLKKAAKSGTGLDFGNFYNANPISIEQVSVTMNIVNKTL